MVMASEAGIFNLTLYPFQNSLDSFTLLVSFIGISSKGKTSDNILEVGKKKREILASKGSLCKVPSWK